MGKVTHKGFVKLGERGQFAGGIITGGNLRRPTEKKSPPAPKVKAKPKKDANE